MASSTAGAATNKYAGLPDIDLEQQDVYETADIQDDVSTIPTSLSDDEDQDIERQGLSIEAARQRFANERVDAEYADFSDTLTKHGKQSYRTSRQDGSSTPETLEEKVARVKREMEEIRVEMAKKEEGQPDSGEVEEWDKLIHSFNGEDNATSLLTSRVQKLPATPLPSAKLTVTLSGPYRADYKSSTTYALSYSPQETTQLATLSSRLTTLESLLGLPLTALQPPVLPTLTHLSTKLNILASNNALDHLSARIKSLTTELTSLEEKREQARQKALLDPEDTLVSASTDEEDPTTKINALYAALENIDKISPLVPGVVERLRTMSRVHADAAGTTGGMKDVRERLGRMERDLKEWEEGILKVEIALKEVGGEVGGVAERIEEVVTGLQDRIKKLSV